MPRISVIVPVYRVEAYLSRCIDSILNQTFSDFELILVDDGSPDNCGKICDDYAKKDSRVVVIHKENGGLSDARNAGLEYIFENSDSEWITFIDSDDWVHEKYLELLFYAAVDNKVEISICRFVTTSGETPDVKFNDTPQIVTVERLYSEYYLDRTISCAKLYRRSLWKEIRFPFGRLHEDEFTTYKLLFATRKIVLITSPLYYYFQNPTGIMKREWTPKRLDILDAFEERIVFFQSNHYEELYKKTVLSYLDQISYSLQLISAQSKYKKYYLALEKRLMNVLKTYKSEVAFSVPFIYVNSIDFKNVGLLQKIRFLFFYVQLKGLKGIFKKIFKD